MKLFVDRIVLHLHSFTPNSLKIMSKKDEKKTAVANERKEFYAEAIKRTSMSVSSNLGSWNIFMIEEKAKILKADFDKFSLKVMACLCENDVQKAEKAKGYEEMLEIENLYCETMAKLKERMAMLQIGEEANNQEDGKGTEFALGKCEKVSIPEKETNECKSGELAFDTVKFSVANWSDFEKDFTEKVNVNDQLSNEKKLELLYKACAYTEAEPILAQLSNNDYAEAFGKLQKTFGTAYMQTSFFVKQLMRIEALENPNAMELISLVKHVDNCIARMKTHLVDGFEQLIPFLIVEKIDENTRLAWERHRKALASSCEKSASTFTQKTYIPDWNTLKLFLEDEADLLVQFRNEAAGIDNEFLAEASKKIQSDVKVQAATSNKNQMAKVNVYCECTNRHQFHKCPEFMALGLADREKKVAQLNLCVRCLRSHKYGDCYEETNNTNCRACWPTVVKHNSMLCPVRVKKMKGNEAMAIVTPMNMQPAWKPEDSWH